MFRFIAPFRMDSSGWVPLVFCVGLGLWIGGLPLGLPIGAMLVLSLLLHEVGHMFAASCFWVPVREFGLRLGGAYTRRSYARRRRDEILISAAGPVANLLLALPLLLVPRIGAQLALGNLALGLVNLLPLPSSDGMRILRTLWTPGAPGPALASLPAKV